MTQVVKILGTRGSVPVSGPDFARYGGATSCVFVRLAGQPVLLDGGTGLLRAEVLLQPEERELPLLLSHPHADHLMGLPMSHLLTRPGRKIHLYAALRDGLDGEEQLRKLMSPPLWPVGAEALPAPPAYHRITGPFTLGPVSVDVMEGEHPGGVTLFCLKGGGKSVAYLTDCTLVGEMADRAVDFVRDCDLLLCDGQYSPEEWPASSTFGHNTWEMAARFTLRCGARQTRVIHHSPFRTDDALDRAAVQLAAIAPDCTFAYEGEEICL